MNASNHKTPEDSPGQAAEGRQPDAGDPASADQTGIDGIDAIDAPDAAADALADRNTGDTPNGFFDGDGSDEGVFNKGA